MRKLATKMTLTLFIIGIVGLASGCARKAKPVAAKFPGESSTATVTPKASSTEGTLGEGTSGRFEEGDIALRQSDEAREIAFSTADMLRTIYFEFDSSVLSSESKASLEKVAQWMKQNPSKNVRVEGNCDERGTTEYNLALGERRALAARRYLISLGVNPDRIFTISYGEEKPAVEGHDEAAWKFNRRDDFGISL